MKINYKLKVLSTLTSGALSGLLSKYKIIITKPIILEFMITSKCDCRCLMCNIWQKDSSADLRLDEIENLFSDPILKNLRTITLAGGEPFRRNDILEICKIINNHCDNLIQLYLSTNGYDYKGIYDKVVGILGIMKNIKRLRIAISFDGIGEAHDKIRGRKGIHNNALELIKRLKKIEDPRLTLQGNFTIAPYNIIDIWENYKYFEDIGIKIFWFPIMTSDNFFENVDKKSEFTFSTSEKIKLRKFVLYLKNQDLSMPDYYYYTGLSDSLNCGYRTFPCSGGSKFLMINSVGEVYPCYIIPKRYRMGSIRDKSLSDIWKSEEAMKLRNIIMKNPTCLGCIQWYDGYALSYSFNVFSRLVLTHPKQVINHLIEK